MNRTKSAIFGLLACLFFPVEATAQYVTDAISVEVISGWQRSDGSYIAAIRFDLEPGWKTYWRAPGDAGIPPRITTRGSRNMQDLQPIWPTPEVFDQNGMRSVGYKSDFILPVIITPKAKKRDVSINAELAIGVCKKICIPASLKVKGKLAASATDVVPEIAAAMADQPFSASEARLGSISCDIHPIDDGMRVVATMDLPSTGAPEFAVIETDNAELWVSEAKVKRNGATLQVSSDVMHVREQPFFLSRDGLRITVLGSKHAVDITGCSAS